MCGKALESKVFKLGRTKTSYMERKFSSKRPRSKELVTIAGEEVQKDQLFYLGLIIHINRNIEKEVKKRVKANWLECRNASGVVCNWQITTKTSIRFAILSSVLGS